MGVEIESICAENATCGKCRVLIEEGDGFGVHSALDHVSAMGPDERAYIDPRAKAWASMNLDPARLRLSCQAQVCGDVVVFVPESSRGNRQIVRKAATDRPIEVRPSVRRYYVELVPPTLEEPLGDLERLTQGLVTAMTLVHSGPDWVAPSPEELRIDHPVLQRLADSLRRGEWKATVAVRDGIEMIDVQPGYHEAAYGVAVDLGTTAIALYLCDLGSGEVVATESMMNPQTAWGDDIMSRMTYQMEHEDGLEKLNHAVITALNRLLRQARRAHRLAPNDILEMVVVGNTTMHHLFLNLPTAHLGLAPYVPTLHRSLDVKARDLRLDINPSAYVHLLPIEASFVGADNMAVLLAEAPHLQDEELLIIDVGTNAEIVLGNRERLLCTSTPTGPAFEGAHVEYGMRAAPGAIERVRIDPETLEPTLSVIADDREPGADREPIRGICGSAIIDAVAEMFRVGLIDARGRFVEERESSRVRRGELGWEYVLALAEETSIGRDIPITVQDVRQIQLTKAALYSATQILLREAELTAPDRIILAGAFGAHIDPAHALILGMIPDRPLDRMSSVGNAAGDGARIALLNRDKRREASEIAASIRRIELPVDQDFQDHFMMALHLPHMTHRFPSIEHLIPDAGPDPLAARFVESMNNRERR